MLDEDPGSRIYWLCVLGKSFSLSELHSLFSKKTITLSMVMKIQYVYRAQSSDGTEYMGTMREALTNLLFYLGEKL